MIEINGHIVEKNNKGQWIWKAKESNPISIPRLKPKHNERPEFPLSETIEQKAVRRYEKQLGKMTLEITNFLKKQIK